VRTTTSPAERSRSSHRCLRRKRPATSALSPFRKPRFLPMMRENTRLRKAGSMADVGDDIGDVIETASELSNDSMSREERNRPMSWLRDQGVLKWLGLGIVLAMVVVGWLVNGSHGTLP
jgi:hypothetical protein